MLKIFITIIVAILLIFVGLIYFESTSNNNISMTEIYDSTINTILVQQNGIYHIPSSLQNIHIVFNKDISVTNLHYSTGSTNTNPPYHVSGNTLIITILAFSPFIFILNFIIHYENSGFFGSSQLQKSISLKFQ